MTQVLVSINDQGKFDDLGTDEHGYQQVGNPTPKILGSIAVNDNMH